MDAVRAPRRVIGRYVLYDLLASGGMATVHLGRLLGPVGFSRTVAIKRLHEQFAADPEFVSSFLDEARLAARVRHPNVVPTLDVVATDGQLFLVMEFVQGESLARLIKASALKGVKVPPRIAVGVLVSVLHGLHAAHEAQNEKGEPLDIVHRDVSPQNILVGIDGVPRVLDFGVAKAVGRLQTTHSKQLKGKISYMSPEQLRSEPIDRRTDVFAAATVLWETLASKRLFAAENEGAVVTKVLLGKIEPPSSVAPDVPKEIDAIVMRGLDRDPAKRYQTAREMALALEEALPPATASQIASWVDGLVHETLSSRAARLAEIESASSSDDVADAALSEIRASASGPFPTSTSQSSISVAAPTVITTAKPRWVVPVIALVAASALVTVWVALHANRTASAPIASAVASVTPSATPPTSASAEPAPIASITSVASVVSSAPAHPARPTVTATAKKVDCTSPFTRDELGRKIYKPECLE